MSSLSAAPESLVTPQSSGAVITKAFRRLAKVLDALAADMPQDLPKAAAAAPTTRDALRQLAQRLSNTVTKYVLFICREGTMNTIEKQTNLLLDDLRKMVTLLRALYPVATPLQRKVLARVGVRVLGNIRELVQDIGKQVVHQIETQHDPESDPNSFENNNHLSRLTARVWGACEALVAAPLTPMEATSAEIASTAELIADAVRELGEYKQGTHEHPRLDDGDSDEDEDEDEDAGADDGDDGDDDGDGDGDDDDFAMPAKKGGKAAAAAAAGGDGDGDVLATGAAAGYDADDEEAIRRELEAMRAEEQDGVEEYHERALAKSEYLWVPGATALVRAAADIMAKTADLIGKIEPPAELARGFGGEGEAPAADPAWGERVAAAKAALDAALEARCRDAEYLSEKSDELVQALATPQKLVRAALCSYIITARCAKVLAWLEELSQQGWLAAVHAAAAKAKKKKAKKAANAAAEATDAAAEAAEAGGVGEAAEAAPETGAAAPAEAAAAAAPVPTAPAAAAAAPAAAAATAAAEGGRTAWHEDGAVIPAIGAWEKAGRERARALATVARAAEERWAAEDVPAVPDAPGARPVTVTGAWGWLDAARQQLAAAYSKEPSLYRQHLLYKAGDEPVDNSDGEESEDEGWEYDDEDGADEDDDGFDDFD